MSSSTMSPIETANEDVTVKEYKKQSQGKMIWRRFKKNKLAVFGMIVLVLLIIMAIAAPLYLDYSLVTTQDMKRRYLSPGEHFPLGTDHYGRDIFARIVYGARTSLSIGLSSVAISMALGTLIGAVAGYYGGRVDNILMRFMDVILAMPQTLLAISIVAALGGGATNLLIAMTISTIPRFSRIVRSAILTVKEQEFIEAAKAYGASDKRIIGKYIIPNAMGPIIVQGTLNMASSIISISGLSFLGLGIPSPRPEWGSMLAESKGDMRQYPYLVMIPGMAIVVTVLALNLIGDGLRDALDPRLKN